MVKKAVRRKITVKIVSFQTRTSFHEGNTHAFWGFSIVLSNVPRYGSADGCLASAHPDSARPDFDSGVVEDCGFGGNFERGTEFPCFDFDFFAWKLAGGGSDFLNFASYVVLKCFGAGWWTHFER